MVEHDDEIKEEDTEEKAFEEFSSTLDNVLEKLSQENKSLDDFYGLMYDTDDDASISKKSCEHFVWDWDSLGTEVDWQDDPLLETEDFFVRLMKEDQARVLELPKKSWSRMKSQRKIEEEVYVCQPPGFEDPDFPDRVYKVEKALYGLHQAPKSWYETLSTYYWIIGFREER
ncbi:RNA-directed DNA polymerase, eukaryota, reverse transcriptase zinc-binding domain protein [Tanacetum coccineum]